jgi:hypothetical protein
MKLKTTFLSFILILCVFSINAQDYFHADVFNKNKYNLKPLVKHTKNAKEAIVFSENFDVWPLAGWTFYELGDTVGWTDLVSFGGTNGGYQGPNAAIHTYEVLTGCDDWMVSPAITITDVGTTLSFWEHLFVGYQFAGHQVIALDGADPATANILDTLYENSQHAVDYWEEVNVSLGNFVNKTIYIAFRYASESDADIWGIDELTVSYTKDNDMMILGYYPEWIKFNNKAKPSVTIKNAGNNTQNNFTVSFEILNGENSIYSETKNFTDANLTTNQTLVVEMNNIWTADIAGDMTVKASVTLGDDEVPGNNIIEETLPVVKFTYSYDTVYAYGINDNNNLYRKYFVKIALSDTSIKKLPYNNHFIGSEIYAGDYAGDYDTTSIIAVDNYGVVYYVGSDGRAYYYGQLNNVPPQGYYGIMGFTWDKSTNSYYACDAYQLYSVNLQSMNMSLIGTISETAGIVSIAANSKGDLYGIGILEDKLYSIDKTTGAGTEIGDIGFNMNFAQDIGFDRTTDSLYGTLYGSIDGTTSKIGLYTFNLETGEAIPCSDAFESGAELSICAIYTEPEGQSIKENNKSSDIKIYPNPVENSLTVSTKTDNISNIFVADLSGKEILNINPTLQKTITINLSLLESGMYIISVKLSNERTIQKQFIKQ